MRSFPFRLSWGWAVLLLLALALTGSNLLAQQTSLSGTIFDPQEAVVPGVTVTLVSEATGASREAVSDDEGRYVFRNVMPGVYSVQAELVGFKKVVMPGVRLQVDTPKNVPINLELGGVSEIVTVAASTERLMNQTDGSIGNAYYSEQIVDLPLESRNVFSLLSVQPGVTEDGYVSGARSDQSNLTLDGIDVNEQQTGEAFTSVLRVTPESVQEFRVTVSNPNASQGRSSGAQVSLVTKSGSNAFHGSLYEFHRNTATTANDFFNNRSGLPRAKLIRNVYGGSIGGPIKKDKAFFFFNYEGRKDRSEETRSDEIPLAHLGDSQFKYVNGEGNVVTLGPDEIRALYPETGGVNPIAAKVLGEAASKYPANDTTRGDQLNTGGFRFNGSTPLDWNTFAARVDFNVADSQQIYVRANYQWDHEGQLPWWPDTASPTYWSHPWGMAASHNWMISPTFINTFRFGITRQAFSDAGDSNLNDLWFRFYFQPRENSRTLSRTTPMYNITDDISWIKGNHTLQFGTNIRIINNNRTSFANSFDDAGMNPSFYQGSGATLDSIPACDEDSIDRSTCYASGQRDIIRNAATSLLGRYSQISSNYIFDVDGDLTPSGTPAIRGFATNEFELYFEDSWQATADLTLNMGIRWGVNTPVWEKNGFQTAPTVGLGDYFDQRKAGAAQGVPFNETVIVDTAGPFYDKPGFYATDWNNWGPRISAAYSPNFDDGILNKLFGDRGQSVIRGGFSMMYDRVGSALAVSFDLNNTLGFSSAEEVSANTYNTTDSLGPLFTGWDQQIRGFAPVPENIEFPLAKPADGARRIESTLDDTLTTPINYNWNVSIGRELPGGLYIEASYLGRKANNLLATRDIMHPNNIVDPASGQSWYEAAKILQEHRWADTPIDQVAPLPFFENMFPDVPSNWWWAWDSSLTSTQNAFAFVARDGWDLLDWTFLQDQLDAEAVGVYEYTFFQPQYGALSAFSTVARSNYNAFTLTARERFKDSLTFDINYTWAKSMDNASGLQTSGTWGAAFILNPLDPDLSRSISDFDVQHIINTNWLWQIPVGRGNSYFADASGVVDAILGGWSFAGVFRWNSGLPQTAPFESSRWSTNWQLSSNAMRIRDPQVEIHKGGENPNMWRDPVHAYQSFRDVFAGQVGDRNVFRLQSFITFDFGLHKTFMMPYAEGHELTFRWDVFNATNTQRLDEPVGTRDGWGTSPDPQLGIPAPAFGNIDAIQGRPRVMQFGLRYAF